MLAPSDDESIRGFRLIFCGDEPNTAPNRLKKSVLFEPKPCYNRLMTYNWQQADWPDFRYDLAAVIDGLLAFAAHSGRAGGLLKGLPDDLEAEAVIDLMLAEAIQSNPKPPPPAISSNSPNSERSSQPAAAAALAMS
jgi:hypothetical protein